MKTNSFTFILMIHWWLKEHLFSRTCSVTNWQYAYIFFKKSDLFCLPPAHSPHFLWQKLMWTKQLIDCGLSKIHQAWQMFSVNGSQLVSTGLWISSSIIYFAFQHSPPPVLNILGTIALSHTPPPPLSVA